MKKVLAFMLALVLVLSLAACGSGGNSNEIEITGGNSNEIEITLDNYNKYLSIGGYATCNHDTENSCHVGLLNGGKGIETKDGTWTWYVYMSVDLSASVRGLSQNFNYNDIKVTGTLKGTYKTYDGGKVYGDIFGFTGSESFEEEVVIECDITGNGGFYKKLKLKNDTYTHEDMITYDFSISSISGTVTPA